MVSLAREWTGLDVLDKRPLVNKEGGREDKSLGDTGIHGERLRQNSIDLDRDGSLTEET